MSTSTGSAETRRALPQRAPKRLLFALFGEFVVDARDEPVRTSALIAVLERAGIAPATTRATLDRLTQSGFFTRERRGRELLFSLTADARGILGEAAERVRGPHPFDPAGSGWTLVTFSIPEDRRGQRHRLRSILTWEGFAPLRDGLWLAPGEVDLDALLLPLRDELPPGAVAAFHARDLPTFPIADSVQAAWDVGAIRAEHDAFIAEWRDAPCTAGPLATTVMLVADWLELLRADPRLPARFLGDRWPAPDSLEVYRRAHRSLAADAADEFAELCSGG